MNDHSIKQDVREFYDRVGWQKISDECFQNAQYEDLRPVAREYIHCSHLRVKRHLAPEGLYLLDAGSGPVQYPEYLTYSEGYEARVCMDISIVALQEARKRLGAHGRYVVGDIAHLPFKADVFDGIVSLHTIHHVPMEDQLPAYDELYRTLKPSRSMVVVNGWTNSPLMTRLSGLITFMTRLRGWWLRKIKRQVVESNADSGSTTQQASLPQPQSQAPQGTFVQKLDAAWLTYALTGRMSYQILVWRSVSVPFLRAVFYEDWGGRFWLKILYWMEEIFPNLLGRIGQYPLIVVSKDKTTDQR